jgi:hypothetical protein
MGNIDDLSSYIAIDSGFCVAMIFLPFILHNPRNHGGCRRWNHIFGAIDWGSGVFDRRKFRSQTSHLRTDAATVVRKVREEKEPEKRKSVERRQPEKVAKHCFFQYFAALEGRKVGSLKQRGRRHLVGWDQKVQAAVARNTCGSQNVKNTAGSEHFWKLRCWKSARNSGAKRIAKLKWQKHHTSGSLLELEMLKKCTPLWH